MRKGPRPTFRELQQCAHVSSRGFSCYVAGFSAQHLQKCERVFRRCAFGVIVEVDVHVAIFV